MTAEKTEVEASFEPTTVDSSSAAEKIALQLRTALIDGSLRPGDRLQPEPDLAEAFGVSRATVREAIKILRGQGIVRTTRGSKGGHFLMKPQTEDLAETLGETYGLWFDLGDISVAEVDEARFFVERAIVRLAAERRTEEDLEEMRTILEEAADESISLREFLLLEVEFHRAISRSARNRLLSLPMSAIHIVRPRTNKLLPRHHRPTVLRQHRALYEAIASGDPDVAEQALLDHVEFLEQERAAALAARRQTPQDVVLADLDNDEGFTERR